MGTPSGVSNDDPAGVSNFAAGVPQGENRSHSCRCPIGRFRDPKRVVWAVLRSFRPQFEKGPPENSKGTTVFTEGSKGAMTGGANLGRNILVNLLHENRNGAHQSGDV